VRTGRGQDLGNTFTNSSSSACHDGSLALQIEKLFDHGSFFLCVFDG
jgi:hypothetical protein